MSDSEVFDTNERYGRTKRVVPNPTWIVGGDISDDYTSAAIDTRGYELIRFRVTVDSTSDPIGDLYFEGCDTEDGVFIPMPIELGKMFTSDTGAITHVEGDLTEIVVNDPAADAAIRVAFLNPPEFMRFRYVQGSGGSATGLSAGYSLQ